MKENQIYRLITVSALAGLLCLVFFMQSLHPLTGHHHEEEDACSYDGMHIHDEEHRHFSCSICYFNLSPTDLDEGELSVCPPEFNAFKLLFDYKKGSFTQQKSHFYLRGPPPFDLI